VLARVIGGFALQLISTITSISIFTDDGGTCYLWTGMAVAMGLMIRTPNERVLERYSHVISGVLAYFLLDYYFERFPTILIMWTALCNATGQVAGDYTMRRIFPCTPLSHRDVQRLEFLTALMTFPVLLGSVVASVPGSFGFHLMVSANLWEVFINYSMGHIAGTAIVLYPAIVLPTLWRHREPLHWRTLVGLFGVAFIFAFADYGAFAIGTIVFVFCTIAGASYCLDQWSACLVKTIAALLILGLTAGGRGPFFHACYANGSRDVLVSTQLSIFAAMTCSAFISLSSAKMRSLQASNKASLEQWEKIFETQTVQLCRVGHDLLNNASIIQGVSESIADSLPAAGRSIERLGVIQAVVTMNDTLMKDMLDYFRPKGRPCAVRRAEIDLRGLLETHLILAEALTRMAKKSIKTTLDMGTVEGSLTLFSDRDRLNQVISNLIGNAVKYTVSGSITLRVARRRRDDIVKVNSVIIQVIDTGVGIDAEDLPKIFGDLFRCSRGAQIASGTGLGLSSVLKSCQLLGAQVTAESPGIDQGSTFTLEFPSGASYPDVISTSTAINNNSAEEKARASGGRAWTLPSMGLRALVVDDSHVIREMMKKYVIRLGCDVVGLESAERAKEYLLLNGAEDAFDVVITDLYLGEGCCMGTDLLLDIRMGHVRGLSKDTPCILCSGMDFPIEEYGGNTFFMLKPFTLEDVSDALGAVTVR
ncbi:unnamed protein product, partial [Pylaiella littoralis]